MIHRLSIKAKITLVITTVSLTSLLTAMSAIAYNDYKLFKKDLVENTQITANMLASSLVPALLFGDIKAADESLDILKENPQIIFAAVYDMNQLLVADYSSGSNHAVEIDVIPDETYFTDNLLITTQPITFDNEDMGSLVIKQTLSKLDDRVAQYTKEFIVTFLITLILLFILASILQRIITSPIQQLVAVANRVSNERDYHTRVEHQREDEIGVMLDAFNEMVSVVEVRDKQLLSHSEELEQLVKLRTEQLHERANFDALTNLPNRYLLLDRLSKAITHCQLENERLAVLFLDLDRFKVINDNLGHDVGDDLLKAVANRLIESVRHNDTVCRLGGDEFFILLTNTKSVEDAKLVVQNILDILREPFEVMGHKLHVSTSIGIAMYPEDGESTELLMRHADTSMYDAKRRGLGLYSFFKPEFEDEAMHKLTLEIMLRHAIENNEFYVVYEPKHCAKTNQLVGFEALLRWEQRIQGTIPPSVFIPVAEDMGLINEVGLFVMEEVCWMIHRLESEGYPKIQISLNISAKHLMDEHFIDDINRIIEKASVASNLLEIEITEETFLHASEEISHNLESLKKSGITIAIDDFGTGYSSLNYLRTFPVDTLKIDGCFIRDLDKDKASRGIVSSTVILGHSLGLSIVAERVETASQLEFLKKHNCDVIQGFYFSKPIEKDNIFSYIKGSDVATSC